MTSFSKSCNDVVFSSNEGKKRLGVVGVHSGCGTLRLLLGYSDYRYRSCANVSITLHLRRNILPPVKKENQHNSSKLEFESLDMKPS